MKWETAKRNELYAIAADDEYARFSDRVEATAEIQRRDHKKHPHQARNQIKVKGIFPK